LPARLPRSTWHGVGRGGGGAQGAVWEVEWAQQLLLPPLARFGGNGSWHAWRWCVNADGAWGRRGEVWAWRTCSWVAKKSQLVVDVRGLSLLAVAHEGWSAAGSLVGRVASTSPPSSLPPGCNWQAWKPRLSPHLLSLSIPLVSPTEVLSKVVS
jgi:hypothetical protein